MTLRETAIAKLQQVPEPLLQEISDFIDFVIDQHQPEVSGNSSETKDISQAWKRWFERIDRLEVNPSQPSSEYQEHLLNKYRQQGLDL